MFRQGIEYEVRIPISTSIILEGILKIPRNASRLVIFVHGSGSSRLSPRNMAVAKKLQSHGIGTLLVDLLTQGEDELYSNRFDIELLTTRVFLVTTYLLNELDKQYRVGYFGASTGAAAALKAAYLLRDTINAVVCRGGRPDLAQDVLEYIKVPTLFVVGGNDTEVLELNKKVYSHLTCEKKLEIVNGATHLFEEEGALEEVARLATEWFGMYLKKPSRLSSVTTKTSTQRYKDDVLT